MSHAQAAVIYGAMLTVTLIASVTDARHGLIPNWLTLPMLLIGPFVAAAFGGWRGLGFSLLGIAVAGGIPLFFHRIGGMGGGDVKLFAALGALGGPRVGLEIELIAACCACVWGIATLAYRGQLLAWLRLCANVFLPAEHPRRSAAPTPTYLRLGGAIFIGTMLAVASRAL